MLPVSAKMEKTIALAAFKCFFFQMNSWLAPKVWLCSIAQHRVRWFIPAMAPIQTGKKLKKDGDGLDAKYNEIFHKQI